MIKSRSWVRRGIIPHHNKQPQWFKVSNIGSVVRQTSLEFLHYLFGSVLIGQLSDIIDVIVHSTVGNIVSKVQISPVGSNNTGWGDSVGDWSRPPMVELGTQCYQAIANNLHNERNACMDALIHTYV